MLAGKRGQAPTYQDLLKNPSDERQFAYYTSAQVVRLGLDGTATNIGQPGIILSADPSPDGKVRHDRDGSYPIFVPGAR
jgi:hypothetical protein